MYMCVCLCESLSPRISDVKKLFGVINIENGVWGGAFSKETHVQRGFLYCQLQKQPFISTVAGVGVSYMVGREDIV